MGHRNHMMMGQERNFFFTFSFFQVESLKIALKHLKNTNIRLKSQQYRVLKIFLISSQLSNFSYLLSSSYFLWHRKSWMNSQRSSYRQKYNLDLRSRRHRNPKRRKRKCLIWRLLHERRHPYSRFLSPIFSLAPNCYLDF